MEPAAASTSSSSDEEQHCNDFMEASTMSRRRAPSEWDDVAGVICCDDDEWFRYRVVVALRVLDPPPLDDSFAVEVRLLVFPATIIPPPRCSHLWSNDDDETTHDLLHDVHPSSTAAPWTRQHRGGAQAPAVVDPLLSPTALAQLVTPTTTTRTSWQSREEDDRGGREPPIELLVFPARRLVFSPHSSLSDDEEEEVHDDDPLLSLSSSSSSNNSEDDDEAQVVMCETCVRLRRLIIDADKSRDRLAADLSDALSMLGEVLGSRHAAATHHPYAVSSLEILPSKSWSTDVAIEMARRRILESPPAPSFATDEEESESPDDESCSVWRVLKFEEEDQDDDNNICKADKQQEEKEEEEEEQSDAHQQQRKKKSSRHGCRMLFPLLCGCLRRAAFAPKSKHLLATVMIEAGALALHLSAQKILRRQPRRPPPKVIPTSS